MRRPLALVVALILAGCTDDDRDADRNDGVPPANTFAVFVIDVVENHTVDESTPLDLDAFDAVPDPDLDENNEDAYASLFVE